jgi:uncharacterized protein (DUF1800 family)
VDKSIAVSPPKDQFEPFAPLDDAPWDVPRAGHLLRRLTFGSTRPRLDALLKLEPGAAVDSLLDYDPDKDPYEGMLEQMEGLFNLRDVSQVQQWLLYRMVYSPQPAQEKIVLFWHNHFATSGAKVENGALMHKQIEMFRSKGLDSFRDLLIAVACDPAMLIWLDGKDNRRGKPNENFAREVMELFALGVGNYTEKDVKELARAFTGWRLDNNNNNYDAVFHPEQHDLEEMSIFGETGKYDTEGALDLILKQPAAPKYLAKKMLRGFVHPHPTDDQIEHYAKRFLANDWNIKTVLREMVTSRMFFSEWAYRSKIKSPAELVIGSAIEMGGKPNMAFLRESMAKMGQNILFPPNVKGWDGEESWINSNTVLVRFNFGMAIATQRNPGGSDPMARQNDLETPLKSMNVKSADQVIDAYARVFLDGKLPPGARDKLIDYMNRDRNDQSKPFVLNKESVNSKVRDMLHVLMTTPEYQLS